MDKDAVVEETAQAAKSIGGIIADEIGKLIKSGVGQATGNSTSDPSSASSDSSDKSDESYEELKKREAEFKKKAEAEWFQKYNAVYANAAARGREEKARLDKKREMDEEEEKKLEKLNETRVRQNFVNRAVEQTRPENKNYGAE